MADTPAVVEHIVFLGSFSVVLCVHRAPARPGQLEVHCVTHKRVASFLWLRKTAFVTRKQIFEEVLLVVMVVH